MKISVIHPSRSRPEKSFSTIRNWMLNRSKCGVEVEFVISLDSDDPLLSEYERLYDFKNKNYSDFRFYVHDNKSSVEAINSAARACLGDVLMVVSDDTEPAKCWDCALENELKDKTDWILKTQDGIQSYIITMPIMDRAYYNRFGYIYHPGFDHLFCDTYLTCLADINGRSITSNLLFPHRHYSHSGGKEGPDELHKRNDATWKQGEALFIKLMKEFTPQQRSLIKDQGMKNWLRNKGVV